MFFFCTSSHLFCSWYHGKITKKEAYNLLMTGTSFISWHWNSDWITCHLSVLIKLCNKLQLCANILFFPFAASCSLVGQVCSFLVRPSDNTPGDYSLFFRTNEIIQRFKISPTSNNQYMMGGRYYNRYQWICKMKHHFQSLRYGIFNFYSIFNVLHLSTVSTTSSTITKRNRSWKATTWKSLFQYR